jgi:hypothetical protein
MLESVYYDPQYEAAFGTLEKLKRAVGVAKPSEVKQWLLYQDAYTLHRSVRKRIPRNRIGSIISWTCGNVISWTYRLSVATTTATNI